MTLDVRSLAQYVPFDTEVEGCESVHDELVSAASQSVGGSFVSLEDCRTFVQERWRIELELTEVRAARDRLAEEGLAERNGGGIALTSAASKRLEEQREAWEAAERTAIDEWEQAVRLAYPLLGDDEIGHLRAQLRPWVDQIITRHGAEASLLLFPDDDRAIALVETMVETGGDFLPPLEPDLEAIRPAVFRLLVHEPTKAQRAFLGRLLNVGFHQTALSLDPRADHLAKAEARQITLYLDTNFLYCLLGVNGPTEAHAGKRLIEICKALGYRLRVTPWTIDELRTSIRASRENIGKARLGHRAATVMSHVAGDTGIEAAYWRELRDKGTSPEDFFDKYQHFARFLAELGIDEHPQGCPEIEADAERVRVYTSPLEGLAGVGAKRREIVEHDAKMRILIENLRGDVRVDGYSDVRYWFLTASSRELPAYARMPVDGAERPQFPFCVLSSTWAQVARALLPRTEDLDEVMVCLLASPYIGHKPPPRDAQRRAVDRVISRMETLKDVPPSVAIAVLNDRAMSGAIGREVDEELVNRLVEESLSKKAAELEERLEDSARRVVDAERAQEAALADAADAASQMESAKQASEAAVARAREQEAEAQERAELAERAKATEEARQEALRDQLSASQTETSAERVARAKAEQAARRLKAGVVVAAILLIGGTAVALILADIVVGRVGTIVTVAAACCFIYAVLRLAFKQLAKEVNIALAVFAVVASAMAAIWAGDDTPAADSAPDTEAEQSSP